MTMHTLIHKKLAALLLMLSTLILTIPTASAASLALDLQELVSEGNTLNTQLASTTLTADNLCSALLSANKAANIYIDNISAVDAGLAAPLSLDADVLTALNQLSQISIDLANQALRLSLDINTLSASLDMFSISDGLVAMLQLSDDIGTMADRILEMTDDILTMADNIGLMADLIIETQTLQNQNIALTQASTLTTQNNILSLISVVDSSSFNTTLQDMLNSGNLLSLDMGTIVLTSWNMASKLSIVTTDVATLKNQIIASDDAISLAAASNTLTINQESLTTLADMTLMVSSLSIVLEAYAHAIEGLAPITSDPSLASAIDSMLQLSADIGLMANRILEMSDLILAMADNIGLAATHIVATQELQNLNIAATQAAILSAQTTAIGIIAANL